MKKREIPAQLIVFLVVLLGGLGFLAFQRWWMKWYPQHQANAREDALRLLPYRNDALGLELQIAAGLYGKLQDFPGGVRITRPRFWSVGPSLTITSQPNPDGSFEFSPQVLAIWQTKGVIEDIPRYRFYRMKINGRDAVMIWQFQGRAMMLTARVISPERIVEANCTPGQADEELFMRACEASLRTLKVAGPEPPPPPPPEPIELTPPPRKGRGQR